MARVTFYTRAGCHLCDVALTSLKPFEARGEISIEVVDLGKLSFGDAHDLVSTCQGSRD